MDQGQGRLTGRTALITGASRNIGRAIAVAFAAEGADLVLNTRANRGELDAVAEECRKAGVRAVPLLADIADADAVEAMVGQARAELGAIDVLVCNAAIRPHKAVGRDLARGLAPRDRREPRLGVLPGARGGARDEGAPAREHHRAWRAVEPDGTAQYRRRHRGQDRSPGPRARARRRARPLRHPRQHGDARLHRHRAALRRVVPGVSPESPGAPEQLKQIPLGRLGRPEDIADACVFLASDASSYVTGDSIRVMGGRVTWRSDERAHSLLAPATARSTYSRYALALSAIGRRLAAGPFSSLQLGFSGRLPAHAPAHSGGSAKPPRPRRGDSRSEGTRPGRCGPSRTPRTRRRPASPPAPRGCARGRRRGRRGGSGPGRVS